MLKALYNYIVVLLLNHSIITSQSNQNGETDQIIKKCPSLDIRCMMNGNVEGAFRIKPEGESLQQRHSESVDLKIRIQGLTSELELSQKETTDIKLELEREKSERRKDEGKLIKEQRKLKVENDELRKELTIKNKKIDELFQKINQLQSAGPPSSLHGTPQLALDSNNSHSSSGSEAQAAVSFMQSFLAPKLKLYKHKVEDLTRRMKEQKEVINMLMRRVDVNRPKGLTELRRPLPSSMDLSTGSTGLHTGGPPTSNLNLTLSLASVSHERPNKGFDGRSFGNADVEKHAMYKAPSETDKDSGLAIQSQSLKFSRQDPVESSDHVYANEYFRRHNTVQHSISTLDSGSTDSYTNTSKKPPKPVPRARSLKSMTMSMGSSAPIAESMTSTINTYEVVDKQLNTVTPYKNYNSEQHYPPATLGPITESVFHSSNSSPVASYSGAPNQPNVLTQNLTQVPHLAERRNNQACDVCHLEFPNLSERQFMDHCLECAEQAAAEEERATADSPLNFSTRIATESRICPVCDQEFSEDVPQTNFENHVHGHFLEEEGWNVPKN